MINTMVIIQEAIGYMVKKLMRALQEQMPKLGAVLYSELLSVIIRISMLSTIVRHRRLSVIQ